VFASNVLLGVVDFERLFALLFCASSAF